MALAITSHRTGRLPSSFAWAVINFFRLNVLINTDHNQVLWLTS